MFMNWKNIHIKNSDVPLHLMSFRICFSDRAAVYICVSDTAAVFSFEFPENSVRQLQANVKSEQRKSIAIQRVE